MKIKERWRAELSRRFAGRPLLNVEQVAALFNPPLPAEALAELADVVKLEFGVALGQMRPEDRIELLIEHPEAGFNPLVWLTYESSSREGTNEVHRLLGQRLKRYGTSEDWARVTTIGELLLAWCGRRSS